MNTNGWCRMQGAVEGGVHFAGSRYLSGRFGTGAVDSRSANRVTRCGAQDTSGSCVEVCSRVFGRRVALPLGTASAQRNEPRLAIYRPPCSQTVRVRKKGNIMPSQSKSSRQRHTSRSNRKTGVKRSRSRSRASMSSSRGMGSRRSHSRSTPTRRGASTRRSQSSRMMEEPEM